MAGVVGVAGGVVMTGLTLDSINRASHSHTHSSASGWKTPPNQLATQTVGTCVIIQSLSSNLSNRITIQQHVTLCCDCEVEWVCT